MFFDPFLLYLKALVITLVVEVGIFVFFVSKKPIAICAAVLFNLFTHLSLHLLFYYAVVFGIGYGFWVWLFGEILVWLVEGLLYYISKIIPNIMKSFFWAFIMNIGSILIGMLIDLL